MNEEIDSLILEMLRDAALKDLSEDQLKRLEHKLEILRKAKAE